MLQVLYKKSFTLIELLVVVSIIILVTGGSLSFYNNFTTEKKLDDEVAKLMEVLNLAKKKATAADINTSCTSPNVFSGYRVTVNGTVPTPTPVYYLEQCCGAIAGTCTATTTIANYLITPSNNNVIITTSGNVTFKPLASGAVSAATITVKLNTSSARCIDVTVTSTGSIDKGSQYSC